MDNQDTTTSPTPLCPKCNTAFSPIPLFPAINLAQLRSNAIPSSTEKIRIRAILEIEKDQLRLYDEELDRLEGVVKKLREERNRLEQRLRNRKGWMAGIRRLPVELLVKIFSHLSSASDSTLTIYLDKDEDDAEVVLAPSLILSQVSHHWREVAVSCPDLWSSIEQIILSR
ncbi:hypothetical protein L218DRAFT_965601 [Marasmius fiardii PR-910]|nr:hypothetical protein L218DRAFT_965601 [Marasmius fiardii PR-910]